MTEDWEKVEAEGLTVKGQICVLQQSGMGADSD